MNLLFFATKANRAAKQLRMMLEELVPEDRLVTYNTVSSLSHRLRQPRNNLNIAVFAATSGDELMDILSLGDLLSDIRIILVLPDNKSDTITKAHTIGPRFLTYLDSNFEEIKSVLSKMLENSN